MLKVYSILTNTDIAMELRKSAAEQLAVILEGKHRQVLSEMGDMFKY